MYTDIINVSDLTGNRIFQRKKWNLRGNKSFRREHRDGQTRRWMNRVRGKKRRDMEEGKKLGVGVLNNSESGKQIPRLINLLYVFRVQF